MYLSPKHEYSGLIYAELLSSIGTKIVELAGPAEAIRIFSKIAVPVAEKDAKELMKMLGVRPGNAASAALAEHAVGCILGMKATIVQLDPKKSILRSEKCLYGDVVSRYKHMLICCVCTEYGKTIASSFGATMIKPDKKISTGNPFCEEIYESPNPADPTMPNRLRIDLAVKIAKVLADKNELLVSTLSGLVMSAQDVTYATLGQDKALKVARNAYAAGEYHGPLFASALKLSGGPKDADKLINSVRETTGGKANTYFTSGGFTIYTKNCPQKTKCTRGGFIETACAEYTRGLLSGYGNYEVRTDTAGLACKQDLMQTSPRSEGRVQSAP